MDDRFNRAQFHSIPSGVDLLSPDYLVLGHITRDLLPDRQATAGGTALYAAVTAQRLGLRVAVFTAAADLPDPADLNFPVVCLPTKTTSTFENRYTHGQRHQWVHAIAPSLNLDHLPASWHFAPIVHLGPVLWECLPDMVHAFPGALVGVTPQGWMRQWQAALPAPVAYVPWEPDANLLRHIGLLVLSREDVQGDEILVKQYASACPLVALTHGAQGVTLYVQGVPYHLPAQRATEVDPTGAGDVFAAAMLVRLYETGNPLTAAQFATFVAAAAVEGVGLSRIPSRAEVLERMG